MRPLPKPDILVDLDPGVEVKDSPIHGKGVFATRWFKPGELIGTYRGSIVVDSSDVHILWLQDEEERFFGIMPSGAMGFLNCCSEFDTNNAILAENSIFIYCRRNILPGEEILISYEFEGDEDEDEEEE
jgi:hypothetical protein